MAKKIRKKCRVCGTKDVHEPDEALIIEQAIFEIAKRADISIDRMDLGITLHEAMSKEQRHDLVVMMGLLVGQKMDAAEILAELYHDLNAFKQLYLNPGYAKTKLKCFCARSAGMAAKAKRLAL